jgi:hypothetical protein
MFKKLSDSLNSKYSRKIHLAKQLEIVTIFDIFREEVSSLFPNSADVKPVSLKGKNLHVHASNAAVAGELRLYDDAIIKKINEAMRKPAVERIIYRF